MSIPTISKGFGCLLLAIIFRSMLRREHCKPWKVWGELAKVTYAPIAAAGMEVGELFIRSFPTSHDSAESVGYQIELPQERKITLATDLGVLTQPVKECLQGSDSVILESNDDVGMLQNGMYPYPLKRRILSDTGHLSNHDCADYLPELIRQGTTRILLSHLSHENNTPDLAGKRRSVRCR